MPIIGKGTLTEFREAYKRNTGRYPTPLGDLIGIMQHDAFYWQQEMLAEFIDSIFPDFFPVDIVQNCIIKSIGQTYYNRKWGAFDAGAEQGDAIWRDTIGKVNDALEQMKKQVDDAKNYIETNLINPIKDKINNEITPKVDDVLNRIKTAETTISDAQNRINQALTDVSNLKNNVASLNNQTNTLRAKIDQTVRDFNAKITDLQNRLNSAGASLDRHTENINELYERVKTLEEKMKSQTDSFAWLRSVLKV